VRIITRYIVREHAGPLAFALTALTSLLLLQYVARQLDKLVGKGLPWRVIGEFLLLSLPFTIAMTLPMAVLMSTMHAFGRLAAEHEVTAFKASGVRVRTLMAPMLVIAAVLSFLMIGFNDQVLPRANHRLSVLLTDIVNVRPTVGIREQVLTQLTPTFYMKVGWIDDTSNRMREVEIYDLQNSAERKSVYADSGTFTMSADSVDLQLVLFDGEQLQFPQGDAKQLQRTFFREQVLKVQDLARGFNSSSGDAQYKSEREQGICDLQREYVLRASEYELRRQRWIAQLRAEASKDDSVVVVPRPRPPHEGLAKLYCETIPGWFAPKVAEAAPAPVHARSSMAQAQPQRARQDSARLDSMRRANERIAAKRRDSMRRALENPGLDSARTDSLRRDSVRRAADAAPEASRPNQPPPPAPGGSRAIGPDGLPLPTAGPDGLPLPTVDSDGLPLPTVGPDGLPMTLGQPSGQLVPDMSNDSANAANARRLNELNPNQPPPALFSVTPEMLDVALMDMNKYAVEVQKKFALSMAVFVFVLFGPPIALRFPRGGVGVTLGVSMVVFGAYYVCLMAGETLADKGRLEPVIAMWAANVIFTIAGVILLLRVEKTADGSRGGGLRDWWSDRRARRALRRTMTASVPSAEARA